MVSEQGNLSNVLEVRPEDEAALHISEEVLEGTMTYFLRQWMKYSVNCPEVEAMWCRKNKNNTHSTRRTSYVGAAKERETKEVGWKPI